jgi:DNA-binding CsgD family transcriptional regulator
MTMINTIFTGKRALPRRPPVKSVLTPRENEVLRWVAEGKSAREIGEILAITKRTVDEHVQTAMNRTNAVTIALRDGLIKL